MNTIELARARHMRSTEDIDAIIAAAHLRRERRIKVVSAMQGWFPSAAGWRALDLAHEAQHLIDKLESRRADIETAAAEAQWEDRFA